MSEPWAMLSGRWLPQSQATLTLHDAGFVMGATVTDMLRTYGGTLYRWADHLARFRASSSAAQIEVRPSDEQITAWASELVQRNRMSGELCLVLFATPGPIGFYLGEPGSVGEGEPTFGMHTFPLPVERFRKTIAEGAMLMVPSVRAVSAASVDPHIKQRSRMHWWLADREARQRGLGVQALLLDEEGYVTETAAANLVVVQRGTLRTPRRERVLSGISLLALMELAAAEGLDIEEADLSFDEVLKADELLLTSTPYGVAGVRRFELQEFMYPGPMFVRLRDAWSRQLGRDMHAEFR
ncbi:MAG: aminotransferase class IV [Gemmataceae bacterium]|nr:aminotransferase class IV [Gemmataceae bacterium]